LWQKSFFPDKKTLNIDFFTHSAAKMSDNKTTVVLLRHNAPHVICCTYYFLIFFGYVKTGMNVEWFSPGHEKL